MFELQRLAAIRSFNDGIVFTTKLLNWCRTHIWTQHSEPEFNHKPSVHAEKASVRVDVSAWTKHANQINSTKIFEINTRTKSQVNLQT